MGTKNSKIDDTKLFFEKKFQTKIALEEFEKLIFEASRKLDKAIDLADEMETIALKRKAYYFLHRARRLKYQLEDLKDSKGYQKKEFDFSYKLLEKIDENDSSEFLDKLLKGSIEKLAINLGNGYPEKQSPHSGTMPHPKKYFTFTFRGVHFLAEKKPQKIVRNVNHKKSHVRIGLKRYPIQPGPGLGIPPEEGEIADPTHLCILKFESSVLPNQFDYRCFFFHTIDKEILFDESTVKSRLRYMEEGTSPYLNRFFRYAGTNYYLIEMQE